MRVLIIKLSSMGDIIHTLPAMTDAAQHVPNLEYTWVVEPGFAEIAHWHSNVSEVIPLALRDGDWRQVIASIKQIRSKKYDLIIDAQGLIKSAVIAKCAKTTTIAGFDWQSCREGVASLFYNQKYAVSWQEHAVLRLRKLFANIFKYSFNEHYVDYGVAWDKLTNPDPTTHPYVVFLHGTTWESKHWPDEYWISLAKILAAHNLNVAVTWATQEQKQRAQTLANQCPNVQMLPHLSLHEAVNVLHHALGVVAVDTGFAHLSAALNKPLVAIYGPTNVAHSGTVGNRNINLSPKFECSPCNSRLCKYAGEKPVNPPCFFEISPQVVWQNLNLLLNKAS